MTVWPAVARDEIFLSKSHDGGALWTGERRLSDVVIDEPVQNDPSVSPFFATGTIGSGGTAYGIDVAYLTLHGSRGVNHGPIFVRSFGQHMEP